MNTAPKDEKPMTVTEANQFARKLAALLAGLALVAGCAAEATPGEPPVEAWKAVPLNTGTPYANHVAWHFSQDLEAARITFTVTSSSAPSIALDCSELERVQDVAAPGIPHTLTIYGGAENTYKACSVYLLDAPGSEILSIEILPRAE